jgi:5-methylcytosine-specific restriction endonuclease McrBC GTP-binding regulatory subunit McrB
MSYNKIYFGPPGSGKSHKAQADANGKKKFTVTFHPEFDYNNFVGSYKPMSVGVGADSKITYAYVPQYFLKAYVAAWRNPHEQIYLIVEEINRGNCAQIFGDTFQLLDRDDTGFSRYFITVETEIETYLEKELGNTDYNVRILDLYFLKNETRDVSPFSILLIPANLTIIATMNTSDQSLFPMDSAFKRRWQWEYVPINYDDANAFRLNIVGLNYNLKDFLQAVNEKIYRITESEDKQLGNRFITSSTNTIAESDFVNKVMFFLWFDIFKDEDTNHKDYIFKFTEGINVTAFKFSDIFTDRRNVILTGFFANLGVQPIA